MVVLAHVSSNSSSESQPWIQLLKRWKNYWIWVQTSQVRRCIFYYMHYGWALVGTRQYILNSTCHDLILIGKNDLRWSATHWLQKSARQPLIRWNCFIQQKCTSKHYIIPMVVDANKYRIHEIVLIYLVYSVKGYCISKTIIINPASLILLKKF